MTEIALERLVLLKLESADRRVFFVLKTPKFDHQNNDWTEENDRYHYEEHSCPTNWLTEIVGVIENGDEDPHGFLEFVKAIDVPKGFNESWHSSERTSWTEVFPEIKEQQKSPSQGA